MREPNEVKQSGLAEVTSPDVGSEERFDEAVDRSLTNDLEDDGNIHDAQKLSKKVEKNIAEDLGGFKTI